MADDELLAACGPSWEAMTPAQRTAYGPPLEMLPVSHSLSAIIELMELAFDFPRSIRAEGFEVIARRFRASAAAIVLAEQLGHLDALSALQERSQSRPTPVRQPKAPAWQRDLRIASVAAA